MKTITKKIAKALGVPNTMLKHGYWNNVQSKILTRTERKMPDGGKCPKCKSKKFVRSSSLIDGPWGGEVICKNKRCGYRDSVIGYLVKQMVTVVPLKKSEKKK